MLLKKCSHSWVSAPRVIWGAERIPRAEVSHVTVETLFSRVSRASFLSLPFTGSVETILKLSLHTYT